jgi:uncharacterized protein
LGSESSLQTLERMHLAPTSREGPFEKTQGKQAPPLQKELLGERALARGEGPFEETQGEQASHVQGELGGRALHVQTHGVSANRFGVRVALVLLSCYKAYLSPLFAGTCKFEPTCSRYAYEAIERFGVLRGGWLGLRRLARCQPFARKFGWDPVPEKWEAMRAKAEMMDKTGEVRP